MFNFSQLLDPHPKSGFRTAQFSFDRAGKVIRRNARDCDGNHREISCEGDSVTFHVYAIFLRSNTNYPSPLTTASINRITSTRHTALAVGAREELRREMTPAEKTAKRVGRIAGE